MFRPRWPVDKVDWNLSDIAIAKQFGIHDANVGRARKRLNKPAKLPKRDWASVDWEKTDPEIAKQLGCGRNSVRNKRNELRKPKVKVFRISPARYNIMKLLAKGTLNVGQIRKKLLIIGPRASERLVWLRDQGLVKCRRKGTFFFYSLTAIGRRKL